VLPRCCCRWPLQCPWGTSAHHHPPLEGYLGVWRQRTQSLTAQDGNNVIARCKNDVVLRLCVYIPSQAVYRTTKMCLWHAFQHICAPKGNEADPTCRAAINRRPCDAGITASMAVGLSQARSQTHLVHCHWLQRVLLPLHSPQSWLLSASPAHQVCGRGPVRAGVMQRTRSGKSRGGPLAKACQTCQPCVLCSLALPPLLASALHPPPPPSPARPPTIHLPPSLPIHTLPSPP
jgi:hypothetical protein